MNPTTQAGLLALRPFDISDQPTTERSEAARLIKRGQMYPHVFEVEEAILYRSPTAIGTSLVLPRAFQSQYGAGVLGFAMIGKTGDPDAAVDAYAEAVTSRKGNTIEAVASIVELSDDLVMRLYTAGVQHRAPAQAIAEYLVRN